MKVKSESEVAQSCLTLCDPMDCSLPGSSTHGFPRQEYWSGLPLPSPELAPSALLITLYTFPEHRHPLEYSIHVYFLNINQDFKKITNSFLSTRHFICTGSLLHNRSMKCALWAHNKWGHWDLSAHSQYVAEITLRYHLTSARMAIIKKSTNNKC